MSMPTPLVSTEWLAAHLEDEDLVVFDTTVYLKHKEGGGYLPESGLENYGKQHLPGAFFLDIIRQASDPDSDIPFMMPPPQRFADILADYGVTEHSQLVFYNDGTPMWSTRAWWMARSIGIDAVAVLDGGWQKWSREQRPTSSAAPEKNSGSLIARPRPEFWTDKSEMLASIDSQQVCTVNALAPAVYSGETNQYGRPGHIPGSHNVFYGDLIDPDTGVFRESSAVKEKFEAIGALGDQPVVVYCGGGISATMDALMLLQLGKTNVSIYDGSMSEWIRESELPLTLGGDP